MVSVALIQCQGSVSAFQSPSETLFVRIVPGVFQRIKLCTTILKLCSKMCTLVAAMHTAFDVRYILWLWSADRDAISALFKVNWLFVPLLIILCVLLCENDCNWWRRHAVIIFMALPSIMQKVSNSQPRIGHLPIYGVTVHVYRSTVHVCNCRRDLYFRDKPAW